MVTSMLSQNQHHWIWGIIGDVLRTLIQNQDHWTWGIIGDVLRMLSQNQHHWTWGIIGDVLRMLSQNQQHWTWVIIGDVLRMLSQNQQHWAPRKWLGKSVVSPSEGISLPTNWCLYLTTSCGVGTTRYGQWMWLGLFDAVDDHWWFTIQNVHTVVNSPS